MTTHPTLLVRYNPNSRNSPSHTDLLLKDTSTDMILQYTKKPGNYRSEKLRLVHGVEETENQTLKISVAWDIKRLANKLYDIFYEYQFGRQHHTCLIAIILKQITVDSLKLTETPGIIIDNDATGAFDWVICGLALLDLRSIGFALSANKILRTTWNKRKCFIKTGFGVSDRSCQSTETKQTYELGQGFTTPSDIWCIIHGIFVHTFATYFVGIVLVSVSC
jgi:hypothetical protein